MHQTAYNNAQKFYDKYCSEGIESKKILDIGSYDVNGTVRPIFEKGNYTGLDMAQGPNVDIVSESHNIDLPNETFDIILSTSCFEHDEMFWVTFLEMCRLIKPGGYIYVNAPSSGPYHGHPGDCWRFYKDSWGALLKWAKKNNYNLELVESYIDDTGNIHNWNDSVGIFKKI